MIIVVFGISGVGKTFLCEAISQRLHFKKFNKIKIRERRPDERGHKDVIISDEKFLNTLREEGKIALEFKLFDNTYAFLKEDFCSTEDKVLEMSYLFFDKIKTLNKDVFTIYIFPSDIDKAIQKIKDRKLKPKEEELRIEEGRRELDFMKDNDAFLKNFDIVAYNSWESNFVDEIIDKIKRQNERLFQS
jgi:guanylate kinase